jgi:SulP family sulfate permease
MSRFGNRETVAADARAGLTLGVVSVPDGLASGLLAGVNPAYGLYAYLVGTAAGALTTSSVYMTVNSTGAMAVIVADVPILHAGSGSATALFTLSVLTGVVMLVLGLLRLGVLVRFVPNAVLTGFVNAVAVTIVLGQLANLTGYTSDLGNRVTRAIDTVLHPLAWNWAGVAVGLATVAVILLLERTRVGVLALVVAVVGASVAVAVLGLDAVPTLDDVADVPTTLPRPSLPDPALVGELLVPALSLALVGLVQGAGISNSIPNPDGRYPDTSGDFRGQGVASIAAGMLQGTPVGGSMSATALVTAAGARTRLAQIIAAVVMAVLIVAVGPLLGSIAMPALAALLMLVGVRTFKLDNVLSVWRTGPTQATTMAVTFVLTLLIPLQYAVLAGVGLSIVLYVAQQSSRVTLTSWTADEKGRLIEGDVPRTLEPRSVVVLQPYGSLFFAAAPVLEDQLPRTDAATSRSVVVLRLRGKQELGSTFISVVRRYADDLAAHDSRLFLAGVSDNVRRQLDVTRTTALLGEDAVFLATPALHESLEQAVAAAEEWVSSPTGGSPPPVA